MLQPDNNFDEADFDDLTDLYLQRVRSGESISPEDFAKEYPGVDAERIEELPLVLEIEDALSDLGTNQRVNREISNYFLTREIGRGGMGVVYEAYQKSLDREVAIKVVRPSNRNELAHNLRFELEAKAVSMLRHPNIVTVFDYGVEDEFAWLAMPLIEGQTLSQVRKLEKDCQSLGAYSNGQTIKNQRLIGFDEDGFRNLARIGADVASALHYAHQKGIFHRDIKPANLILDENQHIWVSDFGLAKILDNEDDLSVTGDMIGTPRYMAPEQMRGAVDARSDVYGLGVSLWELATGERAWESVDDESILNSKTIELPEANQVNSAVPAGLNDIIMKACSLRPQNRYQTADELRHVLNRFAHGHRTADRRKMVRDKKSRPYIRVPFLLMAMLAAICVGVVTSRSFLAKSILVRSSLGEIPRFDTDKEELDLVVCKSWCTVPMVGIQAKDPELARVSYRVVGGKDKDLFYFDQFTHQLCLPEMPIENLEPMEVEIEATDAPVMRGFGLSSQDASVLLHGFSFPFYRTVDEWQPKLSRSLRGLASPDGKVVYHAHVANRAIQLWRSQIEKKTFQLVNPTLLSNDCGLPVEMEAMETLDGKLFFVFCGPARKGASATRKLQKMRLSSKGVMTPVGPQISLPIHEPIRRACYSGPESLTITTDDQAGSTTIWSLSLREPVTGANCIVSRTGSASKADLDGTAWPILVPDSRVKSRIKLRVHAVGQADWPVPMYSTKPTAQTIRDLSNKDQVGAIVTSVQNASSEKLHLVWIKWNGQMVEMGEVGPGQETEIKSIEGGVWEFYGPDGLLWDTVQIRSGQGQIILGKPREFLQ